MTTEKKNKLIDKVRKLLALSESPNEHEAALAASMAQDLLLKYNLSTSEVEMSGEEVKREEILSGGRKTPKWWAILLNATAQTFYCTAIQTGKGKFILLGAEADIITARSIFNYLVETVERLASDYIRYNNSPHHKSSTRTSYSLGCSFSIIDNLREMKKANEKKEETSASSSSTAIVRMEGVKKDAINQYISRHLGRVTTRRTNLRSRNYSAYNQGHRDGRSVQIRRGVKGSGRSKQLS